MKRRRTLSIGADDFKAAMAGVVQRQGKIQAPATAVNDQNGSRAIGGDDNLVQGQSQLFAQQQRSQGLVSCEGF